MRKILKNYKIFIISAIIASTFVIFKFILHELRLEPIEQSSLHTAAISSVIFVMSFILSATISDYKESERIPADYAATIEDMYDDAKNIHTTYPVFDIAKYRDQLLIIAEGFAKDARVSSYKSSNDIRKLSKFYIEMESGKVPPNFIVKLKQQQTVLLRNRHRVDYIQSINFLPSATFLAKTIVILVLTLLAFTNVDPFYGGLAIVGIVSYVLIYMLILIDVISLPFQSEGKTRDDVSLFLMDDTINYLKSAD